MWCWLSLIAGGLEGIRLRTRAFKWCLSPIEAEWMLILLLRGLLIREILNICYGILVLSLGVAHLSVDRGMLVTLAETTIQ
jgi:hypothetical protein